MKTNISQTAKHKQDPIEIQKLISHLLLELRKDSNLFPNVREKWEGTNGNIEISLLGAYTFCGQIKISDEMVTMEGIFTATRKGITQERVKNILCEILKIVSEPLE